MYPGKRHAAMQEPNEAEKQFHDHMAPDIFWLTPPDYLSAFRDLTGDTTMNEAAFTSHALAYPGYVNAQLGDGEMVLTVRGDPRLDSDGSNAQVGPTAQFRIPIDEWDQWVAFAQRVRAGGGQTHPEAHRQDGAT